MKKTIYTLGYSGWSIDGMDRALEDLGALIVDVRFVPRSRMPQWSAKRLAERFAERYVYLQAFGNVNYRASIAQARIVDYEGGRRRLEELAAGRPVALLCGCRVHDACHRTLLANRLATDWGFGVVHLYPPPSAAKGDGQPRLFTE